MCCVLIPVPMPIDGWFGLVTYVLACTLNHNTHTFITTGEAPFGNTENMSRYEVFNRITEKSAPFPFFMSFSLKSLISGLLDKNASKRWAYDQVAASPWLKEVFFDPMVVCVSLSALLKNCLALSVKTSCKHCNEIR